MEACIYVSSRAPPRYLRGISLVKNGMLGKSLPPPPAFHGTQNILGRLWSSNGVSFFFHYKAMRNHIRTGI